MTLLPEIAGARAVSFRKHRGNSESVSGCGLGLLQPSSIGICDRTKLARRGEHGVRLGVVRIYLNGFAKGFNRPILIRQIIAKEKFFAAFIVTPRR